MHVPYLFSQSRHRTARGFFTLFVLIVAAVFLILLTDLINSFGIEKNAGLLGADREKATHAAEAGLEYYRWHFAEFPSDLEDGTGAPGPYEHTVQDPDTATDVAKFSLDISGVTSCGVLTSATVVSTGWPLSQSAHTQKLVATYGKPTIAASTTPATLDAATLSSALSNIKTYAKASGVYIASSSPSQYGYKVVFNADGTFDVAPVTGVTTVWGYSSDDDWQNEDTIIASTGASVNYAIPGGCPVIFIEDNVWLEGVVFGKVTLVAANLANAGVDPSIVLTGNVSYAHAYDDGFTAIAEKSVLISLQSPDVMQLSGIYIADKGHFGRHRYDASGTHAVPVALQGSVMRSTLTTLGTIVSTGTITTKWVSGSIFISGYSAETDKHDSLLAEAPPPFTPGSVAAFRFTDWRKQD
ncbi:MAG: hypothetical protein V4437_01015 [Patescibacteria group bacterium]